MSPKSHHDHGSSSVDAKCMLILANVFSIECVTIDVTNNNEIYEPTFHELGDLRLPISEDRFRYCKDVIR